MKKWLIVLAISNVVTLIALSITITVLVMRDYLNTYEDAEKKLSQSDQEKANELTNNFESAKKSENVSRTDDEKVVENNPTTKKEAKQLTLDEYNKIPFELRWCIKLAFLNRTKPSLSYFTIENMLRDSIDAYIGTIVEDHEVIAIEEDRILFKSPSGIVLEIKESYSPAWSKEDLPADKITDYREFQDPDTGEIKPGLQKTDTEEEDSFETIVDDNGNVIKVRKGANKDEVLEAMKKKESEKATKVENTEKKEVFISSQHHSLDPKEVYDIKENFGKFLNQAVLENYWDKDKGMFIGISIVNLDDDSMYAKLGFEKGDVVTHVNGKEIASTFELDIVLKTEDFTKGLQIQILRDGKALKLIYDFSYDKVLEYEQKLREAYAKSGIDPEKSEDDK